MPKNPSDLNIPDAPGSLLTLIEKVQGEEKDRPAALDAGDGSVLIPKGERNARLTSTAGFLRRNGMGETDLIATMLAVNSARCQPPLPDREVVSIARSVFRYSPTFELTDVGNADRLAAIHGNDLRFAYRMKRWFAWIGDRWSDNPAEVVRRAVETARLILVEAANAKDPDEQRRLMAHGLRSQDKHSILAMIELAQPMLEVKVDELDADPWLFNCANGTIDLKTGDLRPHRRDDLITKVSPVEHNPGARSELWERFLRETFAPDAVGLSGFVRRFLGYGLTGMTREEKAVFAIGDTAAGKTTLIEAVRSAMGDYSITMSVETLLAQKSKQPSSGATSDVARLRGARLALASEAGEGRRLNAALFKTLTGGDTVTARHLYAEFFEFAPQFKLWLAMNHPPRLRDNDDAIWRRIARVPFKNVVPAERRDPELKATLRDPATSGPAILAWLVRGCLEWQRSGLGVPPEVTEATEAYRADQDPLRGFFAERCAFGGGEWTTESPWAAYISWANENGERPINKREFSDRLWAKGAESDRMQLRGEQVRVWTGISLRAGRPQTNPDD